MKLSIQETEALINHFIKSKKLKGVDVTKEEVQKYMNNLIKEKGYQVFPNLVENLLGDMKF